MLIPFGILSSAGAGGAYDLLDTNILTSAVSSVTFSNLANYSTSYKHLQIRFTARYTQTTDGAGGFFIRFNGDSGSNYRWHRLYGSGSGSPNSDSATSNRLDIARVAGQGGGNTLNFGAGVCDILDPYNTSKNTVTRTLSGTIPDTYVFLQSGLWLNTASLTSIEFLPSSLNLAAGSRFSLYGIR